MKKKSLLNEVRQLQKIAGILKENETPSDMYVNENQSKFNVGDTLETYGSGEAVTVVSIQPNIDAALKDTKNRKAVAYLEKAIRQDYVEDEQRSMPWYLVKFENGALDTDLRYWAEDELTKESQVNEGEDNLNENNVKDQIEDWYWETKFDIDNLSPEEIEQGVEAHYEEWMASKGAYRDNIQHYFDDVEKKGDWY